MVKPREAIAENAKPRRIESNVHRAALSDIRLGMTISSKDQEGITTPALFLLFLKIGSLSFGGFMALVSVIQKEVCERRKLIESDRITEGVSLATLIPGPIAVNVATYAGYTIGGLAGAFAAWLGVILPSFFLMIVFAVFYGKYGTVPAVQGVFAGIGPAVIAVIISVALRLYQLTVKLNWQVILAFGAFIVFALFDRLWVALLIILLSGCAGLILSSRTDEKSGKPIPLGKLLYSVLGLGAFIGLAFLSSEFARRSAGTFVEMQLAITFGGLSLAMFGGGYVFVPMLREVVVDNMGWLTASAFTDAIAMGQVTPGPIMISSTFIGYNLAGLSGAAAATLGMFLPTAILMVWLSHAQSLVISMPSVKRAYSGIRPCVVGMIAAASVVLSRSVDFSLFSLIILGISLLATIRFKVDVLYLIPAAGVLGYIAHGM